MSAVVPPASYTTSALSDTSLGFRPAVPSGGSRFARHGDTALRVGKAAALALPYNTARPPEATRRSPPPIASIPYTTLWTGVALFGGGNFLILYVSPVTYKLPAASDAPRGNLSLVQRERRCW